MKSEISLLIFFLSLVLPKAVFAQPIIEGFNKEEINIDLKTAIGITFDKSGRGYIWEMEGRVFILDENKDILETPFLDISEEVAKWLDIGMSSFKLHPDFPSVPYVYVLYAVDRHYDQFHGTDSYDPTETIKKNATYGRIARFTADIENNFLSIIPDSRHILLGNTAEDGFPILFDSHGLGSLEFGTDGTLLASCGDAASSLEEDVGSHWSTYWQNGLDEGIIENKDNVGAFRAQMLSNLAGKIIRIDAETGKGLPSNPFYKESVADHSASKIWALGIRNAYGFIVKPNSGSHFQEDGRPGQIYLSDVGNFSWEELNVIDKPGMNLGWPIYEGLYKTAYSNIDIDNVESNNSQNCQDYFRFTDLLREDNIEKSSAVLNPCNDQPIVDVPTFYHHRPSFVYRNSAEDSSAISFTPAFDPSGNPMWNDVSLSGITPSEGDASVGGLFYSNGNFPERFNGKCFHLDYSGWIKIMSFNEEGDLNEVENFYSEGQKFSFIAVNPVGGDIYAISNKGKMVRIYYSDNAAPSIKLSHSTLYGSSPLEVFIDASKTSDEHLPLTFEWFRNGNKIGSESDLGLVLEGEEKVIELIDLRVTDNLGAYSEESIKVYLNNRPPKVSIITPNEIGKFPNTSSFNQKLNGLATDPDDEDRNINYEWEIYLHHNNHTHFDLSINGKDEEVLLSPLGCQVDSFWYGIKLIATDPLGLSSEAEVFMIPNCDLDGYPELSLTTWLTGDKVKIVSQISSDDLRKSTVEIEKAFLDASFTTIARLGAKKDINIQDLLSEEGAYKYRLKLTEENGNWYYSNISNLVFPGGDIFTISSNPAQGLALIQFEKVLGKQLSFQLFSAGGLKVLEQEFETVPDNVFEQEIDLSLLNSGTYFYNIDTGSNFYYGKLIIIE
jgi:hypothetical protein